MLPTSHRRFQVLEALGKLHVFRIIDRTIDDRDGVVGKRDLERGDGERAERLAREAADRDKPPEPKAKAKPKKKKTS